MNTVHLTGNMARVPDSRLTRNGRSLTRFTLAIHENGNTDFIPCKAWDSLADHIAQNISKGQRVAIVGKLRTNRLTDVNGNSRDEVEVWTDRIEFAGPKPVRKDPVGDSPDSRNRPSTDDVLEDIIEDLDASELELPESIPPAV